MLLQEHFQSRDITLFHRFYCFWARHCFLWYWLLKFMAAPVNCYSFQCHICHLFSSVPCQVLCLHPGQWSEQYRDWDRKDLFHFKFQTFIVFHLKLNYQIIFTNMYSSYLIRLQLNPKRSKTKCRLKFTTQNIYILIFNLQIT